MDGDKYKQEPFLLHRSKYPADVLPRFDNGMVFLLKDMDLESPIDTLDTKEGDLCGNGEGRVPKEGQEPDPVWGRVRNAGDRGKYKQGF